MVNYAEVLIKVHKYAIKNLEHIKIYHKKRLLHQEVMQKMIDFYQDYPEKFMDDDIIETVEREYHLHLNLRKQIDNQLFCDLVVFPHKPYKGVCRYFLEQRKFRAAEKKMYAQDMQESELGIFEIISCDADQGMCHLRNILTNHLAFSGFIW